MKRLRLVSSLLSPLLLPDVFLELEELESELLESELGGAFLKELFLLLDDAFALFLNGVDAPALLFTLREGMPAPMKPYPPMTRDMTEIATGSAKSIAN